LVRIRTFVALGLLLGLVACGADTGADTEPDPVTTTVADDATTLTTEELTLQTNPTSDAELRTLAEAARADLATNLGVPEADIAVTSAALVVWNDGAIGCPQPGMAYTQALVDGTRITLTHAGTEYAYHQGGNQEPFLCEEPSAGSYVISEDDSGRLQMTPPPGYSD
jgi:hypothetical protein